MSKPSDPILEGCACPACRGGYTRGYLHYLLRARELTALRLVTLHNLSFIARLMEIGALICKPKNPNCPKCPLRNQCFAFRNGAIDSLSPRGVSSRCGRS